MRLKAPSHCIDFSTQDIHNQPFRLADFRGNRVLLSFFRDAACPFCNTMLTDGVKSKEKEESVQVLDVAELVAQSLARE